MSKYHFIGIGGIGMSALARILRGRGASVQGSDTSSSYVTEGLEKMGIEIFPAHDEKYVQTASTVIYGSAIKPSHPEFLAAKAQNLPLLHRSHLLAELMKGHDALLVAGTHGKTTTSSLLAHVLIEAHLDPSFAIGGIALNSFSNGYSGKGRFFVAEADESDGSFLNYPGMGGIITNIEEDHLDYWKNRGALIQAYKTFATQITSHLWWCYDDPILCQLGLPGKSYGFSSGAYLQITSWEQRGWKIIFDLKVDEKTYQNIELPLVGRHNILNGAAVFGLSLELGLTEKHIRDGFKSFKGVKRRMEHKGENRGVTLLDDYAHHPTEVDTTLKGLQKAVKEKRVIAVFQPHRYTRFKECWSDFLHAFEAADVVFMTDIYGAGETPIEGIDAERWVADFKNTHPTPIQFVPRSELLQQLGDFVRPHDVVITLGAGDITNLGKELAAWPIKPFQLTVIEGGKSAEHEVSLLSSSVICRALDPRYYQIKKWVITKEGGWVCNGKGAHLPEAVADLQSSDLVFPILHGPFGEDGMIQGFLETVGVPYVGSDFRSCAVAMDKAWTKHIALSRGVKVARFIEFTIAEWLKRPEIVREKILKNFQYPFYIKAVHLGSTFGVCRVKTAQEIDEAIHTISKLDYRFLVEEEIKGRELEFGFIGDDEIDVSDPAEVERAAELHTYENKYSTKGKPSIPKAPLPPEILQEGRRVAEIVYRAVGCSGLARIDFFLTADGSWVLNEVNPMPGFTPMSVYPVIWKAEGVIMPEILDRVIIASLHRFRHHQRHLRPPVKPPIDL